MEVPLQFKPGNLVRARGREWVVLPEKRPDILKLRPLGGAEEDSTLIYLPLEPEIPVPATFDLPNPDKPGSQEAALLLRDALRLKLRAGAGPFRSFGNINVEPRAYQLVPLLMALKLDTIRLLVADDVGIGKTIEACLIARELIDRGEIERLAVICPPHLCGQWQREMEEKFSIGAEVVRTGTATRLERGLRPDESIFEVYPYTVVSLDYIKVGQASGMTSCAPARNSSSSMRPTPASAPTPTRATSVINSSRAWLRASPNEVWSFLTATPHSGDDTAFHNLCWVFWIRDSRSWPRYPKGAYAVRCATRSPHTLSSVAVGISPSGDDDASFPVRQSREATYRLSGAWGRLFDDVLTYARTMVKRAEGGTKLQQRMSWWAALALLAVYLLKPGRRIAGSAHATSGRREQDRTGAT